MVRLGGYGPAESTHSRALDRIAAHLRATLWDHGVEVSIDYNILDSGRPVQDLLRDVEAGVTTLCYFSSSYLADRVPEIGVIDLPYLFASVEHAHGCLDGALGTVLSERTRVATGLLPLGYWDNGFRHMTNAKRPVTRGSIISIEILALVVGPGVESVVVCARLAGSIDTPN
jgi:C4-dicarboxylate-binding protein DctP